MTFGRPLGITSTITVPVPATIDDEYLSATFVGGQPPEVLSYMSLFTFSCHLFDILKDVLQQPALLTDAAQVRTAAEMHSIERTIDQTLIISRRLDRFGNSIPTELMITDAPSTPIAERHSTLNLMQQVLYCR